MAEQLPPYNLGYPDSFDDPADYPNLLQSNLSTLSSLVVGQFTNLASALAALGSSSDSPVLFTTKSPSTLWCLDSSGANQIWSLGNQYTSGTFVMRDQDNNTFSVGPSMKSMWYRVEGAHVTGWARLGVSSGVAWPAGKYFWFPLPFAPRIHVSGEAQTVGNALVNINGEHYTGVCNAVSQDGHCVIYSNDPHKTTPGANPVRYDTGNTGTGLTWASGDSIQYSFNYERVL